MLSSYNYIQILEIKEMLDNLKQRADHVDAEINDIYHKINDLYSKIYDIYSKIDDINENINNITEEVNYLKSKKYLYIQDTPPQDTSAAYISPKDMLLRIYKNGKWVPIGAVFL